LTSNPNCDLVCDKLTDMNAALIKTLIETITELLDNINGSIEASGKIDKSLIDEIVLQKTSITNIATTMAALDKKDIAAMLAYFTELARSCPYNEQDKDKLVSFYRRVNNALASWTDEERNAVIDSVEGFGGGLIKLKKKLNRLYMLVAGAGITTILIQVGAPEWLKGLIKLVMGA
jgi:hypothetical protein